ncbi:hypothetical protein E0H73_31790 [Kribbella pittospori]|uniref:Uncharacterized protein n=1 Tax=Kribbella pittospori TaxID=722689 RepID=A0A4R0KMM3_9ACTN|nr:hypothetical protein [Kribbella pittospori]TCC57065.1 hypothetical protein E0H73_31790 [Kribbella pittospori]
MSKAIKVPHEGKSPKHKKNKRSQRAMRNLMVSVLGATGTLYLVTQSIAVTVTGTIAALSAGLLYLLLGWK